MGRRCPSVGPRSFGAPSCGRKGCAFCRHPLGVEKRTTRATAICLGAGVYFLEEDRYSVTLTVNWEQQRQGASHLVYCLGTEELESSRMNNRVACPLLIGNALVLL